jgi:hypothetical protein
MSRHSTSAVNDGSTQTDLGFLIGLVSLDFGLTTVSSCFRSWLEIVRDQPVPNPERVVLSVCYPGYSRLRLADAFRSYRFVGRQAQRRFNRSRLCRQEERYKSPISNECLTVIMRQEAIARGAFWATRSAEMCEKPEKCGVFTQKVLTISS